MGPGLCGGRKGDYFYGKSIQNLPYKLDNFEPDFIHSFHLRGQLEHKYPAEEGGIKLYPKDWKTADTKYHGFLDCLLYTSDAADE